VSLIILDLDNTLVDRVAAFHRWTEKFLDDNDLDADLDALFVECDNDGHCIREDFVVDICRKAKLNLSPHVVLEHYIEYYPQCFTLEDEIKSALEKFSQAGYVLGVATNGSSRQNRVIRFVGLDKLVDGWVVSEDIGIRKPDRRIAEILADQLGQDLTRGYVVGDSIVDIELASDISFQSAWLTRGREWSMKYPIPAIQASTFSEAAEWILLQLQRDI
jgi:FMN phosphatase YigB (HAD superfamily)